MQIQERNQGHLERFETLAHELRTPLTSIQGSLALAISFGETLPDEVKSLIKIAYRNTRRILSLTDNLLEDGNREEALTLEKHSLNHLVKQTLKDCIFFQEDYQVNYNFHSNVENDWVLMDKDKIRVVLENILSNAAKYSKKGDVLDITIQKKEGWFRVSVTDHGLGIPKDFQEKIFNRYARGKSNQQGLGIGLTICKKIIEMHEGHIGFQSIENHGSTFYFELKE